MNHKSNSAQWIRFQNLTLAGVIGCVLLSAHVCSGLTVTYNYVSTTQIPEGGVITGTVYTDSPGSFTQGITLEIDPSGSVPMVSQDVTSPWTWYGGYWQTVVTFSGNTASFSIPFADDGTISGDRTGTLRFASFVDPNHPSGIPITLMDSDSTASINIVSGTNLVGTTAITENGKLGADRTAIRISRSYTGYARTIYYTTNGTASGSDYTPTLSGSVTMAVGVDHADITNIVAASDTLVEGAETLGIQLAYGAYHINSAQSNVLITIYDDYPMIAITALDDYVAESGTNQGVISITRTGNTNKAVTVQLAISGTAVSNVDYLILPTNVVFAAGMLTTNLNVTPIVGSSTDPAKTVVVGVRSNASYVLGLYTNAVVTITGNGPISRDSYPMGTRYMRGSGTNFAYYSMVIPLDGITGTRRLDMDTQSTYETRYHYNATNSGDQTLITNRIPFSTPIASFGAAWGNPLFPGQNYSVGLFPGPWITGPLNIYLYSRINGAYVTNITVALPVITDPVDWGNFTTNGFMRTVTNWGLTTIVRWDNQMTFGTGYTGWQLSHLGADAATNYCYLVCGKGYLTNTYMTLNSSAGAAEGYFYELNFDARPAWSSLFLQQPQFQGQPLPPDLWNKTPAELLHYGAVVSNAVSLAPSACTNIDKSPELRRHPILDQFVSDMNSNALALANYVQNEIDLSDFIAYRDDGSVSSESVNEGGVNRGALGVYLEGRGSPVEQCALLIYLLRQAGYSATYVFPSDGGLKMLDTRLSALLRMRINGAQDTSGYLYTTNQLIPVNYPWVAVNISNQWVHLFPWIKDTSVQEGLDIYDYLPPAYQDMQLWVKDYVYGKPNLMAFASLDDDTAGYIFPRFLANFLQTNAPGVSVDDIGMRYVNRRNLYARWTDFPRPTSVSNVSTAVESLGSASITNVSPTLTNIFDTVQVQIYSVNNPQKYVLTPPLRMVDLHNRKFYLTHTNNPSGGIQAVLTLGPFRSSATGAGTFSTSDQTLTNKQVLSMALDDSDDSLTLQVRQRRQRALSWSTPLDPDRGFLDLGCDREVDVQRPLRKGDVAAICIDPGRVTPAMLRVHAQELWNMEQKLSTNAGSANSLSIDVYQGSFVYLLGMNYYQRCSQNADMLRNLFKVQEVTSVAIGLAKISPQRDANGALNGGGVNPIWPNVDMFFDEATVVGNGSVRLDSGRDQFQATRDHALLSVADKSAQEHATLNVFFGQSNSMSTVKLLQYAQSKAASGGSNIVEVTSANYQSAGNVTYNNKALKDCDPGTWASVVSMFQRSDGNYVVGWLPPGVQTNASHSFAGMGAFIYAPYYYMAIIGNNQYGGYADQIPGDTYTNMPALQLTLQGDASYNATLTAPATGGKASAPEQSASFEVPTDTGYLSNSTYVANPAQVQQGQVDGLVLNGGVGTYSTVADDATDVGLVGTKTDDRKSNGWLAWIQDPVNSLTGEFYIDDIDLTLPGPMPLQIRRNYGSQNQANNQLGYGWKLNYMPYLTVARSNNIVYAAEADGSVIAFGSIATNQWAPSLALNPLLNNDSASGIGSTANRLNARLAKQISGTVTNWYLTNADGGLRVFQEMKFPLTNNPVYDRSRPYLTTWYDCRSNYYKFEYGTDVTQGDYGQVRRIVSSSGNVLRLEYDVYGHVADAYSLDGRRIDYGYSDHGDLISVVRPDTSEIDYEYQLLNWVTNSVTNVYSTHLLVREYKPDGRTLQNDYDSQRRVTNQWSTAGGDLRLMRTASFNYVNNFSLTNITNTLTGTTTILDYANNPTVYYYTNSLIGRIQYPVGNDVIQEWYQSNETNAPAYPRSLKKVTDKHGLITSYSYDSQGNASSITVQGDLRGDGNTNTTAVTSAVYSNNLPIKIIDPSGITNLFFYTNTWLLARQETWPSNSVAAQAITNLYYYTMVTNSADGTVSYGLRWRQVRAANSVDAATNDVTYDSHGFPTLATRYTGTADPSVSMTTLYNSRGELAVQTDAAGRSIVFGYDPNGSIQSREVYDVGQSIPMSWEYSYYNDNGELTWLDGPRYSPEDYVWRDYDGMGRKTQEIHWRSQANPDGSGVGAPSDDSLYSISFFQYDPLGDLTNAVDPRGNYTFKKYDSISRLVREEFYAADGSLLSTNGFVYSAAGDVTNVFNALGGLTVKQYTATGKPTFQKNPDGSTSQWLYYIDGRLWREYQRNGAYWETTYADASRQITKTFYNASGSPLAANLTTFDRRGNVISQTDAAQNVFTTTYDDLDRVKSSSGPAITSVTFTNSSGGTGLPTPGDGAYQTNTVRQIAGYTYDASGVVLIATNALGDKTTTTRDALGRVLLVQATPAGSSTAIRTTSYSYSLDHQSVTVTDGTGLTAVSSTSYTDNSGQVVLAIQSPVSGQTDYVLNTYDLAGNRIESDQRTLSGGQTTWTTSQWTYDGLNRVATEISKDNALTRFFYDSMGNITNRAMPGNLTWSCVYSNNGQLVSEQNNNGGQITRNMAYTYYPAGNSWAGMLSTMTDGRGVVKTTTYDDWLRVAAVSASGTKLEEQMNAGWQYDCRGLLTNISQSFATNPSVSISTIQRAFDPYGQLTSELISLGGVTTSTFSESWDAAGRRSRLSSGSGWSMGYQYRPDGLMVGVNGSFFGYGDNGLLVGRTNAFRWMSVTARDGEGHPTQASTYAGGRTSIESWGWLGDGSPSTYTSPRSDYTDSRTFSYGTLHRRLTQEQVTLGAGNSTNTYYTYDGGTGGQLGVLTQSGPSPSASQWAGGLDAFSRINTDTNTLIHRTAKGTINGVASLRGYLNGQPVDVRYDTHTAGQWASDLSLGAGTNTLTVFADRTWASYTIGKTNVFVVSAGSTDRTTSQFDGSGNVTNRVWKDSTGAIVKTQSLTWDAFNRLVKVNERDASNNGFNCQIDFDALGRQLRVTETTVSNNLALAANPYPQVTSFAYDPAVEFQFVGINISQGSTSRQDWLTYGPDLSGRYGGMQGVGGLETITSVDNSGTTTYGVINDGFGNVVAGVTNGVVLPNSSRISLYGPLDGFVPPRLSLAVPTYQSLAFRTRPPTIFGTVQLGMRPYDYVRRSFLSFDSTWNAGDPNGFSAFGGNPGLYFDPTGRCATRAWDETTLDARALTSGVFWSGMGNDMYSTGARTVNGFVQAGAIGSDMLGSSAAGIYDSIYGTDVQGNYQGYSQLYQNVYNTGTGPSATGILLGTAEAEANIGTFGLYGMAKGYGVAIASGDFSQAQDASLNALMMAYSAKGATPEAAPSPGQIWAEAEAQAQARVAAVQAEYGNVEAYNMASARGPSGSAYSVAYETRLGSSSYPDVLRPAHFQEANEALLSAMEADPQFASMMRQTGVNLNRTPTGLAPRTSPDGWTWHHAQEPGVMQLVPRVQHAPGSIFQNVLHPGGVGGYSIWGQ